MDPADIEKMIEKFRLIIPGFMGEGYILSRRDMAKLIHALLDEREKNERISGNVRLA